MYEFVTGPLAWVAFIVFFAGLIFRGVAYIKGLDWKLDRVTYRRNTQYGVKEALRSIGYWLTPFGTHSWREKPIFAALFFLFHLGLLFTPLFLEAHQMLLDQRWGFRVGAISDSTADALTVLVLICAGCIIVRRMALPEVRIITNSYDILVLAIAVAPFLTGFMAFHHIGSYQFWLITHILSGELWLMAIPFTKLSHFLLFFLSRAQLGMDYGIKRGGMKGKGMAW